MPIRRYDKDYHSIGIVTNDDEEELSFCENCYKNSHELVRLKERLYLDNNGKLLPPPPNADLFRQCWTCGTVVALRDVKLAGTITGIQGVEISQNPLEDKRGIVLGLDDNVKHRYRRLKHRKNKHPDAEIQRLIDQGYELKSFSETIPTNPNE
jgi:hypothetical protein